MLVLSRKIGEKLVIGNNITITVNRIAGNRVTLGIEAPAAVRIARGELKPVMDAFADGHESRPVAPVATYATEDVASASVPRLAK